MMGRRKAFRPRLRDGHPSLILTEGQELSILLARFSKAKLLATAMYDEGVSYEVGLGMSDESWEILRKIARCNQPSKVTRMLALELLKDRTEQSRNGPEKLKPLTSDDG